ncbi:MAG: branched-chain amino acid transport system substrate-binding protein [Acidobacteriota bacterium]|jgi:branched-chain amino acid transport system substrate-binding protein|nr:branched-chain amino acid transport system substrate-binding protein [Acidobacteriota bacterium]
MKNRYLSLTVALLSLSLAGCPPKTETGGAAGKAATTGDIVVGEYGSLTGNQATFGTSTHNGITLAMEEVNGSGGVLGRQIKVITEDDQSKSEEAASAVTKLIAQNSVVAVLGEVASSSSMAAAPVCQSNKIPMISPSSTNPDVTKKGDFIFRMCFIDTYQGPVMAEYLVNTLKVKRVALLTDNRSDYSRGLGEAFAGRFKQLGGSIVITQSFSQGDSDFRSQLTAIKGANVEVLYVPGYYNDIGQIASQARDLGMTMPLAGGDGWESPKLIEIGGKALEGCFYSNHYYAEDPTPEVRNFVEKYKKRFDNQMPDALAALGYDAAKVLADSIKRAGKTDGPALRDAIAQTKGFQGVTGAITLGPDRNPVGKKIVIVGIQNGRLALRSTIDPNAQAAPVAAHATTAPSDTTGTTATH